MRSGPKFVPEPHQSPKPRLHLPMLVQFKGVGKITLIFLVCGHRQEAPKYGRTPNSFGVNKPLCLSGKEGNTFLLPGFRCRFVPGRCIILDPQRHRSRIGLVQQDGKLLFRTRSSKSSLG